MVIVVTKAYNSQNSISRSIESVLNQTYRNFIYYLLDNGSNDETGNIIRKYAKLDDRIIALAHKENIIYDKILRICVGYALENHREASYFCMLDADDEYAPDFLEKMIMFATKNNLDVASCGTDWIDEKTGKDLRHKVIDKTIILEGREFAEHFPDYRNYMVTVWGNVYSLDLLRQFDFEWAKNAMNFGDTAFCMEAFRHAKRAGILGESLHKYYVSSKTVSYRYNPNWFQACKYLHKISREYLLDYGEISKKNEDYLCILFFILIKYIIPRIQQSEVNLSDKLKNLHNIFTDDMTQYVLMHWDEVGIYSNKSDFLYEIKAWLHMQYGWETLQNTVDEIIAAMYLNKEDT